MVKANSDSSAQAVANRMRFAFSAMGCEKYADVAKLLGASKQAVDSWMCGRRKIPLEPYGVKLRELGISIEWLYFGPAVKRDERLFKPGRPKFDAENRP